MKLTKEQKIITFVSVAIILMLIDFLTKKWAHDSLMHQDPINIIGDFFRFRFIWNTSSAFGIIPAGRWTFLLINLIITVGFGYFFFIKTEDFWTKIAYIALVTGGFGNVLDRFLYTEVHSGGAVVDFISFGNFPVFNLADVYVVVATGFIIIRNWDRFEGKNKIK